MVVKGTRGKTTKKPTNKELNQGLLKRVLNNYVTLKVRFWPVDGFMIIIALASLSLRYLIPANIATNTPHDDLLGVTLARSLLDGKWLGDWNNRTLAKPPGFSFFLTFAHYIPVEPTLILHSFYLILCIIFVRMLPKIFVLPSGIEQSVYRLVFGIMAFDPALLGGDFSRIYRISLNTIASMAFAIAATNMFIYVYELQHIGMSSKQNVDGKRMRNRLFRTGLYLGMAYSMMLLTRSEAIWILYPAVFLVSVYLGYRYLKTRRSDRSAERKRIFLVGKTLIIAIIVFMIPIFIVQQSNNANMALRRLKTSTRVNLLERCYCGRELKMVATVDPLFRCHEDKGMPFIGLALRQIG
jgi:hypothetical protein